MSIVINQFNYNHRNRKVLLIPKTDEYCEIPLGLYHLRTYRDLRKFDLSLAPCVLKFPRLELAIYATSALGGTRISTLVFLQSSIATLPPLWSVADDIFYRKPYDERKLMWTAVDANGPLWTEVKLIGAASRQMKYNLSNNSNAASPPELYDIFLSEDSVFMRLKSFREKDSIAPEPYVFARVALNGIRLHFPFNEGDWSNEVESYLTSPESV